MSSGIQDDSSTVMTSTTSLNDTEENVQQDPDVTTINMHSTASGRRPKRILHFSDGILEEYSTDEETQNEENQDEKLMFSKQLCRLQQVNSHYLPWSQWATHMLQLSTMHVLAKAEVCGEWLAYALGITSPKYEHMLLEVQRAQKEELELQEELRLEEIAREKHLKTQTRQPAPTARPSGSGEV